MTARSYSSETYLERIERLVNFEGWDRDTAETKVWIEAAHNRQELWETIRASHQDEDYD
jgi:hypothetical protein